MTRRHKTVMLSLETYDELCKLKTEMEKIFGSPISFDKAVRFLILAKIDWSDLLSPEFRS